MSPNDSANHDSHEDSLGVYHRVKDRLMTFSHPILNIQQNGELLALEFLTRFQGEDDEIQSVGSLFHGEKVFEGRGRILLDLQCLENTFSCIAAWDPHEDYLTDMRRMLELVAHLRTFGVKIAVDDLGSGAASLTALAKLEPNFLKLDRSLIQDAMIHHGSKVQNALLKALSTFSREAGIGLIAEGIETPDELVVVASVDISYVQGFFFGYPKLMVWEDQ